MRIYHAQTWQDCRLIEHSINLTCDDGLDVIESQIEPALWETLCSAAATHHATFKSALQERPGLDASYQRMKSHQRKELRQWMATQVGAS